MHIENDVIICPDGELFLGGGGHSVLRFASGDFRPSAASIAHLRRNLEDRRDAAARGGFRFAHLVAPEKYRILPDSFPIRPALSLVEQYRDGGCEGMLDPVAEMRAEAGGRTYYVTDSHWAPHGKVVAARLLAREAGHEAAAIAAAEAAAKAALHPAAQPFSGDLGRKLSPPRSEATLQFRLPHPNQIHENGLPHDFERPVNDGRLVLQESGAPTARGTLLIFGDSYLHQSLPALSFFFRRTIFCRTRWFHPEMVAMACPDLVVTQQAERYLSAVSPDAGAPPFLLMAHMLGRTPAPSQKEALAIAAALAGGRRLDLAPFARLLPPESTAGP